jgi:RNA polymerase sigma-70 factor (ECF subfamily)
MVLDGPALRTAYDAYGAAVYHLAIAALRDPTDAENAVRATFVAAWRERDGYDPRRGSLLGWLLDITRREVVDPLPGPAAEAASRVVDRLVVADELARLPDDQRRVLALACYDELTHHQIAALTGRSPGSVSSLLSRAMTRLRNRWEVDGAAPRSRPAGPPRPR